MFQIGKHFIETYEMIIKLYDCINYVTIIN